MSSILSGYPELLTLCQTKQGLVNEYLSRLNCMTNPICFLINTIQRLIKDKLHKFDSHLLKDVCVCKIVHMLWLLLHLLRKCVRNRKKILLGSYATKQNFVSVNYTCSSCWYITKIIFIVSYQSNFFFPTKSIFKIIFVVSKAIFVVSYQGNFGRQCLWFLMKTILAISHRGNFSSFLTKIISVNSY